MARLPLMALLSLAVCAAPLAGQHVRASASGVARLETVALRSTTGPLRPDRWSALMPRSAAPLASLILPGSGQAVLGRDRSIAYLAVEALEAETGYSDLLLHGEAVALGCVLAFEFSAVRGISPSADAERVRAHFASAGLPTTLAQLGLESAGERLTGHMVHDKKREGGRTAFILARGIGQAFVDKDVDLADVAAFLDSAP